MRVGSAASRSKKTLSVLQLNETYHIGRVRVNLPEDACKQILVLAAIQLQENHALGLSKFLTGSDAIAFAS